MKWKLIGIICAVIIVLIVSCQNEEQIEFERYYSAGNAVYQSHCQNCHSEKGEGLNGLIPPLTDNAYLKSQQSNLPCLIKNGLKGKINITGRTFEGEMHAADLSPVEIAQVLTYVTNSFGNKMKTTTVEQVNRNLAKCN